ncbi:hypothetical protein [Shewanella violacea]|uniref:Uncharacterized protein n=1 Tax=Shewanella violacea (strain JCM 10179 / CIP 106290 / LMG 19151 / DSS12) TaxID=637905 RepID=D4ZC14_SHEVD|nr:hypothetical protein [Shewanella violacea]BAJ03559.1 conserved hypothetical protein [Shewanella violacea DSS12]
MVLNSEQSRHIVPPMLTGLMVLWALLSQLLYSDTHFSLSHAVSFYPVLVLFPMVVLVHGHLIWQARGMERLDQAVYALIHSLLSFVIWTFSLMHVNGNSFS